MLRSLRDLERYSVSATDGDIGTVDDFFLDDERWGVRYLVVDAGALVRSRRVLISPSSFRQVDWAARHFHLALTRKAIEGSPDVDTERPVSRQHETEYYDYYASQPYSSSSGYWDMGPRRVEQRAGAQPDLRDDRAPSKSEVHLRSLNEVKGYHVQGTDHAIGHIEDFIVDDQTWMIRYLVIDTSNWWLGKKVLVAPQWATGVNWAERRVQMGLNRQAIKASPEWHPGAPVNREYEAHLYDYYGQPVYWEPTPWQPASTSSGDRPSEQGGAT
jgi:hypothetical protein